MVAILKFADDPVSITETTPWDGTHFNDITFVVTTSATDYALTMRRVHHSTTHTIYDNFDRILDSSDTEVALQIGCTVDHTTGYRQWVVFANYGYYTAPSGGAPEPGVSLITRIPITATLSWNAGANTIDINVDDPPPISTVISGNAICPSILVWDAVAEAQVSLFEGQSLSFVDSRYWKEDPGQTGVGTRGRFGFLFDPNDSAVATGYADLLPGMCYGGSWCGTGSTENRIRPDNLKFHTQEQEAWFFAGDRSAWWLQSRVPEATNDWKRQARGQHADAGFGAVVQLFTKGGTDFWTNTAYHFFVKQIATRFLCQFPNPNAGYGSSFYYDYQDDATRTTGRILSLGVWLWRALERLKEWRNDAESVTLSADVGSRVLNIFLQFYRYRKPAISGETPPIYDTWKREPTNSRVPHPDAGGTVPTGSTVRSIQHYQGGLLWHGLYHLWDALREFELTTTPPYSEVYLAVRKLMDYVAVGYPAGTTDQNISGVYTETRKWKGSHPFPPPSPLPPTWASNQLCSVTGGTVNCWPTPEFKEVSGFGWANPYLLATRKTSSTNNGKNIGNDHYEDLQYLSHASTATTGQHVAMYEFLKREGVVSGQKVEEIIQQYADEESFWHLGSTTKIDEAASSTVAITETAPIVLNVAVAGVELVEVSNSTVAVTEGTVDVLNTPEIEKVKGTLVDVSSAENYAMARTHLRNFDVSIGENVQYVHTNFSRSWVRIANSTVEIGPIDEKSVVWVVKRGGPKGGYVGVEIIAPADSKGQAIIGGSGS